LCQKRPNRIVRPRMPQAPTDPSAYRACRVRALGLSYVIGLRQRTTEAVEAGPVFIPCRHLDSTNRAGRLPTALRSREGIVGNPTPRGHRSFRVPLPGGSTNTNPSLL
jgi:hypothetical protein